MFMVVRMSSQSPEVSREDNKKPCSCLFMPPRSSQPLPLTHSPALGNRKSAFCLYGLPILDISYLWEMKYI